MKVVINQPNYIPWLGYFEMIKQSDVFVFYDDVQFTKQDWRTRNKIRGSDKWLSIPVQKHAWDDRINQIAMEPGWHHKHLRRIKATYQHAPNFDKYFHDLKDIYESFNMLSPFTIALTRQIMLWLGIRVKSYESSKLNIDGGQTERLVNICKKFKADEYLVGPAAKNYIDIPLFGDIKVTFFEYQTKNKLSVLDYLFMEEA